MTNISKITTHPVRWIMGGEVLEKTSDNGDWQVEIGGN